MVRQLANNRKEGSNYNNGWSLKAMDLGYNYFRREFLNQYHQQDNFINPYEGKVGYEKSRMEPMVASKFVQGRTTFYGINISIFKKSY